MLDIQFSTLAALAASSKSSFIPVKRSLTETSTTSKMARYMTWQFSSVLNSFLYGQNSVSEWVSNVCICPVSAWCQCQGCAVWNASCLSVMIITCRVVWELNVKHSDKHRVCCAAGFLWLSFTPLMSSLNCQSLFAHLHWTTDATVVKAFMSVACGCAYRLTLHHGFLILHLWSTLSLF